MLWVGPMLDALLSLPT